MNSKNKILMYLSDRLSGNEKIQFERELDSNANLRNEFEQVKSSLKQLNYTDNFEIDNSYFVSQFVEVRSKLEQTKKKSRAFADRKIFALGIVTIVIFILTININYKSGNDDFDYTGLSHLNDSAITSYLNQSELTHFLADQGEYFYNDNYFELAEDDLEQFLIADSEDLSTFENNLNNAEIESVISSLSDKKIF